MSVPRSSRWVAKLWRNECSVTAFLIPAASAAGSMVLSAACLVWWAARDARNEESCLWALRRRKPLAASSMAALVQRSAMEASRQRLTLRQTRRTVPIMFSMMLLVQGQRSAQFGGKAKTDNGRDFVEAFEDAGGDAGSLLLQPGARLRIRRSALSASSSSHV